MYTDSHCHITCDEMYEKIDEILDAMKDVTSAMIMCTNEVELERALKVREVHPEMKVAFGWFPGDAREIDDQKMHFLKELLASGKIDVLGEIGLDYYWDDSFQEEQKELFKNQILLANEYNLPIAIHMRDATKDTLDMLRQYAKTKIIFHCFSGSVETMKEALKLNSMISFAGPITFKNARQAPECIAACPMDRILSETDSPYLAPVPMRSKRNQPAYVKYVEEKIADIKGMETDQVLKQIEENFHSLFAS